MNLFFWKKNNTIDVFSNSLANEFYSSIQPVVAKDFFTQEIKDKKLKKGKNAKKTGKEKQQIDYQIDSIINQINQFKQIHSLGVYGKARLHLKFSERLKELGYDESITKKINDYIMVRTP